VSATPWTVADLPDLHHRRVVVTGANSGIGRVAAAALARAGAAVTLAVRDIDKGHDAARSMTGAVEVRPLDLADLASVRAFAESTVDPVDILIDNAGVMATPQRRTADGFELQLGTNHLGHFALTNLLLPRITDRVVVVTSGLHRMGRIDLDDLNFDRRRYRPWTAYSQSKLANLLFVAELERRLIESASPLRAVAAHPGYAATNLQSHVGNPVAAILGRVANLLVAQSDAMGALPTLYAATADIPGGSLVGPGGFNHMRGYPTLEAPASAALDGDVARELWVRSEELTGITWPSSPAPT